MLVLRLLTHRFASHLSRVRKMISNDGLRRNEQLWICLRTRKKIAMENSRLPFSFLKDFIWTLSWKVVTRPHAITLYPPENVSCSICSFSECVVFHLLILRMCRVPSAHSRACTRFLYQIRHVYMPRWAKRYSITYHCDAERKR